jgi:hypothetical protein
MENMDRATSHRAECESYARVVAERDLYLAAPAEVDQLAAQYLSDGTASCICAELPA